MKSLVIISLSLVLFGMIFADEESDKKKEKTVAFFKCIACGDYYFIFNIYFLLLFKVNDKKY